MREECNQRGLHKFWYKKQDGASNDIVRLIRFLRDLAGATRLPASSDLSIRHAPVRGSTSGDMRAETPTT